MAQNAQLLAEVERVSSVVLERFLLAMMTTNSAPFRDVPFYEGLKRDVIPRLRTYPYFRIRIAGNGGDAYPVAILL